MTSLNRRPLISSIMRRSLLPEGNLLTLMGSFGQRVLLAILAVIGMPAGGFLIYHYRSSWHNDADSQRVAVPGVAFNDCGVFDGGRLYERSVSLWNNTDEDVRVHSVDVSCGCVKVRTCPVVLRRREIAQLVYEVRPPHGEEWLRQRILVATDAADHDKSYFEIGVVGAVRGVSVTPRYVTIGADALCKGIPEAVTVTGRGVEEMTITSVTSDSVHFECTVTDECGSRVNVIDGCESIPELWGRVSVRVQDGAPAGKLRGNLTIMASTNRGTYSATCSVTAEVPYPVQCDVRRLAWWPGNSVLGNADRRIAYWTMRDDINLSNLQLRCTLPGLEASVAACNRSRGVMVVRYTGPRERLRGLLQGVVEGFVGDAKVMEMPVLIHPSFSVARPGVGFGGSSDVSSGPD